MLIAAQQNKKKARAKKALAKKEIGLELSNKPPL